MGETNGGNGFSDNDGGKRVEDRLSRERPRPRPRRYRRYAVLRGMVVWDHEWSAYRRDR